tara:strand:- start:2607 stop:2978 length:372 start_codon:yes stop_codon:yes gene_type:complete
MTTFPSLEPETRALVYGSYPQSTHEGLSGGNVRFLLGTKRLAQRLTITYEYLTETEVQTLLTHYNGQNGSIEPFDLSSQVWAGYSTPPVSSSSYQWRYAQSFQISISSPNRYSTSIELISVPL